MVTLTESDDRIEEEIEEENKGTISDQQPSATRNPNPRSVKTKVPEVEVHLYRSGKGPVETFKSSLGGWDQDQLEVQDILDKYGLKSIFAFTPGSGRGVPIRFSARNGRSILTYRDGAVIYVDGEPKDPLLKPITKIILGVAVMTLMIAIFMKETPKWLNISKLTDTTFPPWVIACMIIAFTRLRKRTKNLLNKFGW
ncbi:uncharacterized protein LOC109835636 [Asparagus officinalis]|uniref:uncharacterized protein LOC109835636 n=1 Tax=Asparagus officinalis TaxID=4686 RepID=UPI00098E6795|nr:uncharacterized protein LOC109835636 [Asparagus officinalis]